MKKFIITSFLFLGVISTPKIIARELINSLRNKYYNIQDSLEESRHRQAVLNMVHDRNLLMRYGQGNELIGEYVNNSFVQRLPMTLVIALAGLYIADCGKHTALSTALISQFFNPITLDLFNSENPLQIPLWKKIAIGSIKGLTLGATIGAAKTLNDCGIPSIATALGAASLSLIMDYPATLLLKPHIARIETQEQEKHAALQVAIRRPDTDEADTKPAREIPLVQNR